MPEITVRTGIPCPQSSTVSPVDRRLLTTGNHPTIEARTIELDERQTQSFTWALNTAQAEAFRGWWRDDLVFGGAWFSAPETWPTPEGLVVKVRRFMTAPQMQYLGNGNWQASATLEVRGRTLLPTLDTDDRFVDNFSGSEEGYQALSTHEPDEAPSGFEWLAPSEGPELGVYLDGRLRNSAFGNIRQEGSETLMALGAAWELQLHIALENGNSEYNPTGLFEVYGPNGTYVSVMAVCETFGNIRIIVSAENSGFSDQVQFAGLSSEVGHAISLFCSAESIQIFDNDALLGTLNSVDLLDMTHMVLVAVEIDTQETGDVEIDRVAVLPDAEMPPPALNTVRLSDALQYSDDYQADLGQASPPTPFPSGGWAEVGSSVDTAEDNLLAIFNAQNQTAVGNSVNASAAGYWAQEIVVEGVTPGDTIAVGIFPVGGPPINLDAAYGGWSGLVTYWRMNGEAGGYGNSGNPVSPFFVGDVIGVVFNHLDGDNEIRFYRNGVYQFAYLPLNSTVMAFASSLPE